jgi:hypothetical protein
MAALLRTRIQDLKDEPLLTFATALAKLVGWDVQDLIGLRLHDFLLHCEAKGQLSSRTPCPVDFPSLQVRLEDAPACLRALAIEMAAFKGGSIEPHEDRTLFQFVAAWLRLLQPPSTAPAKPPSAMTALILQRRANGDL